LYIEYLFGASNTMMQPLQDGESKLEAARSALVQHWQEAASAPNVGLRAYGHTVSAIDDRSCQDTELLLPLAQGQAALAAELLGRIEARGMAPLGLALVEATGDFDFAAGRTNALILVADGGDSCGASPCQVVKAQREAGIRYPIFIIGLGAEAVSREELLCIAESSGGQYRDAASQTAVLQTLDEFLGLIHASASQ
jgi:Ca-activated chloride channel family protein